MHNDSHKSAWCLACLDKAIGKNKDKLEQFDDIDKALLGDDTVQRHEYRQALHLVKSRRGVPLNLIKHLLKCEFVDTKVKADWDRHLTSLTPKRAPMQTTLKLTHGFTYTDRQKEEFKRDFLRLIVGCNIAFYKADHPSMEDFCSKWIGLTPPSRNTLSRRLLDEEKEDIQTKNMSLLAGHKGGTLICDGWNNSKREHLVSFMLLTRQHAIPLRHFDNSAVSRTGQLAYEQIIEVFTWLKEQRIDVYGVCTDDGPDQVCDFSISETAHLQNKHSSVQKKLNLGGNRGKIEHTSAYSA